MHTIEIGRCTKSISEFVKRNWNVKISYIFKKNKCMYIEYDDKVEVYLLQTSQLHLLRNLKTKELLESIAFGGLFLGVLQKGTTKLINPSLELGYLALLSNAKQNIVYVNTNGEKLFLYGRDLFAQSIDNAILPIKYKNYVIVLNNYREYLGLGIALTSIYSIYDLQKLKIDNPHFILIKNYIDLGWYLRHGG